MYQILTAIERMDNENKITTIRGITEYLKENEQDITINITNSSVRHYRKNGFIRRKHNPYKHHFEYNPFKSRLRANRLVGRVRRGIYFRFRYLKIVIKKVEN
ncbi:hypothetical protein ES703_50232 [subsurface metagenome]